MQFYGTSTEDGANAKFERPWNSYAKLTFPWWATGQHPVMYRGCRIGFSPNSRYFIALDEAHGIHVLRLTAKSQFHCCRSNNDNPPVHFYFLDAADQMWVLFKDQSLRRIDLETGDESIHGNFLLPTGALARSTEPWSTLGVFNFTVDSRSGTLGFIAADQFRTYQITSKPPHRLIGEVQRQNLSGVLCRIESSADGRYLGIGYDDLDDVPNRWISDRGRVAMYEVIDLQTRMITRRIGDKEILKEFLKPDGVKTLEIDSEFQACLGDDGDDIVYVEQLTR
ncbi:hypothetical protein [Schlesneria sp. T3-172]|uniref:hypothetical protein n=1 Tax=Schlesneria sphaerica TaxID=3373610 RepID=UPI0037C87A30